MSQPTGALVWGMHEQAGARPAVEAAARACDLAVYLCSYTELIDRVRQDADVVVGIELSEVPEGGLALASDVRKQFATVPIVIAAQSGSVALIRSAFEAGATDVVSAPVDAVELQRAVIKALTRVAAGIGDEASNAGQVITIFGVRGGLGVTTLAVNLAVQLGRLTQANVALADFDLQRGDCAAFLNLTPSQSIATLATSGSKIDDLILFSTLIRHTSGVSVLAAPQHLEEADVVGPEEAEQAVSRLRQKFRFTVVDTSRPLTAVSVAVLAHTDRVLIVSDLSLPGVRSLHRIAEVLRGLKVSREGLDLVLVQGEHDMVPVAEAVRVMGKPPLVTIPRDAAAASAAMNAGAPLNGPKPTALLGAIVELASKLSGVHAGPVAKRGRLQQLFSRGAST